MHCMYDLKYFILFAFYSHLVLNSILLILMIMIKFYCQTYLLTKE